MTLRFKLLGLTVTAMVFTILATFGAIWTTKEFVKEFEASTSITSILRTHTLADMFHEGLRSDVYSAFAAEDAGLERKDIEAKVVENAASFERLVNENLKQAPPGPVLDALKSLDGPLKAYVTISRKLVPLVFEDRPAAVKLLPTFNEQFAALEVSQQKVGDIIEASAKDIRDESVTFSRTITKAAWATTAVLGTTFAILLAFCIFGFIRPLTQISEAIAKVAEKGVDITIPHLNRRDEIGKLAAAARVFQQSSAMHAELKSAEAKALLEDEAATKHKILVTQLADELEYNVGQIAQELSDSVVNMRDATENLSKISEKTL
jgi:methyl-accepting chemotaxis protein